MMIIEGLLQAIEKRKEEFLRFWEELCCIESQTCDKAGVDAAGEYIRRYAASRGWKTEVFPQEISGDVTVVTMNPGSAGKSVVFSGHLDTVHPKGLFGCPPVRTDREADRIYGPGVTDCKGGVVASVLAMTALDDLGFTGRPVKLILQTDEEVSSRYSGKGTVRQMCASAADAAAFLNTEGCKTGKAVLWRKGISRYRFEVTGRAAHSSQCYNGVSAIREAAYKIAELEKYKDPDGMTCSCGMISGGTAENTVPEKCTFTADIRFADARQMADGDRITNEIAAKQFVPGSSCTVTLASRRVSMTKESRNFDLLEKMNGIYRAYGLPELEAAGSTGGSDAADVTCAGIPCIDSLGVAGGGIHSAREYARISSLAESAARLAAVAASL